MIYIPHHSRLMRAYGITDEGLAVLLVFGKGRGEKWDFQKIK